MLLSFGPTEAHLPPDVRTSSRARRLRHPQGRSAAEEPAQPACLEGDACDTLRTQSAGMGALSERNVRRGTEDQERKGSRLARRNSLPTPRNASSGMRDLNRRVLAKPPRATTLIGASTRATDARGSDRDPHGPRPVFVGARSRGLISRAIERDPSVGSSPTRGARQIRARSELMLLDTLCRKVSSRSYAHSLS